MRQWEVWKGVFKEVGKKLAKIEVSFPEEKPWREIMSESKMMDLELSIVIWYHTWLSYVGHIFIWYREECRRF